MADVVNLRIVRKARARAEAAALAQTNRVKFGRTGAEKRADAEAVRRHDALLDGAKREEP